MANVMISRELFMALLNHHLGENHEGDEWIRRELEKKVEAMALHELYTKSKTAPTEEERESARKKYVKKKGIPKDFCR